ncbi:MAG: hypothetical protein AAGC44_14640 [Planctomycetota bacterium]
MPKPIRDHRRDTTAALLLLTAVLILPACNLPAIGDKTFNVKQQYAGLDNRSVAVLVATGDYIDSNYPEVREQLTREVTQRIATSVPGVQVTNPEQVLRFQQDNPFWTARAPSELIRALNVQRLVIVELGEYRTHEPGDQHILRGVVTGNVNVLEAEAPDPNNFAFNQSIRSAFPEESRSKIGYSRVTLNEDIVETEARRRFAVDAAGIFYDHKIKR